jgi:hypothetical protein
MVVDLGRGLLGDGAGVSGHGVESDSDRQGAVQFFDLGRGEGADEVCQGVLGYADEFITADAARMLQSLSDPNRNLGRQSVG